MRALRWAWEAGMRMVGANKRIERDAVLGGRDLVGHDRHETPARSGCS
jgi:hypothetical protein